MTDLDRALRTMLQTRAHDITSVPPHIGRFDSDTEVDARVVEIYPHARSRRAAWLVAASVAAVLAIVGIVVAVGRHGGPHSTQPASPAPTIPAAPHIERGVSTSWFGMDAVPGYAEHERDSLPGYESLALRGVADTGAPAGCNGCALASVYVYVFDKGAFDTAKDGIRSGQQVRVNGASALLGDSAFGENTHDPVPLPSVAWQYGPGEWVLVQGVTPFGSTEHALLAVADAVRPTMSVPIELPCTFGYLPALPLVQISDDRSESYAFQLTFGDIAGRSFTITLWNGAAWTYYQRPGATPETIGGLPGYYDPQQGAGVLFHGGGMAFGFGEAIVVKLSSADAAQTRRVVAGIRWAHGDGSQPWIPAEEAIP